MVLNEIHCQIPFLDLIVLRTLFFLSPIPSISIILKSAALLNEKPY